MKTNGKVSSGRVNLLIVLIMTMALVCVPFSGLSMVEPDFVNVIEQSEQELDQNIVEYDIVEPEQAGISNDLEEIMDIEPEILDPSKSTDLDSRLEKYYFTDFDENGDPTTSWEYMETKDSGPGDNLLSEPPISTLATPHVIIQPDAAEGKDAALWEGSPDMNGGDQMDMTVNNGAWDSQGIIEFNISSASFLDNANITSVELNIYHNGNWASAEPWGVYQVNNSWNESTVTWNNQPESSNIAEDLIWYNGGEVWRTFDVTDIFKEWKNGTQANNGLLLRRADGISCSIFHQSSDGPADWRPYLIINFAADYWPQLSPEEQRDYGFPSDIIPYTITVENGGDLDDTYDLSSSGGWAVSFRDITDSFDITQVSVPAGGSVDIIAKVNINAAAPPGSFDLNGINTTSQNDTGASDEVDLWTFVPYADSIFNDFNIGWPIWSTESFNPATHWEIGDPSPISYGPGPAYSPVKCAGTNIVGPYQRDADTCLLTPYVELGTGPQILGFQNWHKISEWDNDGGFVEISVNGGAWDLISPKTGYPMTDQQVGTYFTDCYYGFDPGWQYEEFDLSAYAGNVVQVRFHFASQGDGYAGWYVDDVNIGPLPSYRLDLTPGISNTYGLLGQSVPYIMTINNTGANDDTYDLSFISAEQPWTIYFLDAGWNSTTTVGPVPAGTTMDFITVVNVSAVANQGDFNIANVKTTSQNDTAVNDTAFIQTQFPIWSEWNDGFENSWGAWRSEVIVPGSQTFWEVGTPSGFGPTPYNGTNCSTTDLSDNYDSDTDIILISPFIEVDTLFSRLTFHHWYRMPNQAGGFVELSVNGGSWFQIYPDGGYPYSGTIGRYYDTDGFTGMSSDWEFHEFNLNSYFDDVIQIRFHFSSRSDGFWGWAIDNVTIGKPPDYRVELTPDTQTSYGSPTEDVDFVITVNNTGNNTDTYDLTHDCPWPLVFRDAGNSMDITSISVFPGSTEDFIARVTIPGAASPGESGLANITAISQNDPGANGTVMIDPIVLVKPPWFDDMESGPDLWNPWDDGWGTTWDHGVPNKTWEPATTHSPTMCWGTNIGSNYTNVCDVALTTPMIDLTTFATANLSFWHWYDTSLGFDGGWVEVSNDFGDNWDQITPDGGYPDFGWGTPIYGGNSSGWIPADFDLSAYIGDIISIRFYFRDAPFDGILGVGWYIDDVNITASNYGVEIVPETSNEMGSPGETIGYNLTITNRGVYDDSFELSYSGNTWTTQIYDSSGLTIISNTGPLAPNETLDIVVKVDISGGASSGDSDTVQIKATSDNETITYDSASIETHVIAVPPWFDDMESGIGPWDSWDNGMGTAWEYGDPTGFASGPGNAYSPSNCWGTNLLSDYTANGEATLTSPVFDLSGFSQATFTFWHWYNMNGNWNDGGWVEKSTDYGASWSQLWPNGGYPDQNNWGNDCYAGSSGGWVEAEFDLSGWFGSQIMFRFRFVDNPGDGIEDPGWYIDDVLIHATDYGVDVWPSYRMRVSQPSTTVSFGLDISNVGILDDSYTLSIAGNAWPTRIYDQSEITEITNTGPVPTGNWFSVVVQVDIPVAALIGDSDTVHLTMISDNDTFVSETSELVTVVPVDPPWFDDMESGTGLWDEWDSGDGTAWEFGNPTGGVGPASSYSPTNCWGTNLLADYSTNGEAFLTSPVIDLSGFGYANLSFWHWYDINGGWNDGGWVELSNDGNNWLPINPVGGYPNIHDIGQSCYAGTSGGWVKAEFDIPFTNQPILFRFHFLDSSFDGTEGAGWYIDDVSIFAADYDNGISQIGNNPFLGYPSEIVEVPIRVYNWGTEDDSYALSVSGNAWTTEFYDPTGTFIISNTGPILGGDQMDLILKITVPGGAVVRDFDQITITAISDNISAVYDDSWIETHVPLSLDVWDDMESGIGIWEIWDDGAGTTWELGDPSPWAWGPAGSYSPTNCWGTNINANYTSSADSWIETPWLDLRNCSEANLSFWHWYDINGGMNDGGWIEFHHGFGWSNLAPEGVGYPDQFAWGYEAYAGTSGGWTKAEFDMGSIIGRPVKIRIHFRDWIADGVQRSGWYLDDIRVQGETWGRVKETVPPDLATGVSQDQDITVIYTRSMDSGVVPTLEQLNVPDPGGWSFLGWSTTYKSDDTATWGHNDWTLGQAVEMTVYGGQDLSGQKPDQYWWDFTVTNTLTTATATGPTGTSNVAPITITYTTGGGPASAALYYTTNTAAPYTWNLIGTDTPADGSYGWTIPTDGRYGWFAVAPDESAPTSVSVPEASTYVYDSTPPTSSVDLIPSEYYNTGPLGITATANDALSGVDYVELWYSFDGSLYGLFGTDNDGAPYDWSFNWPDGEGYYEFYTIAVDNANNAETLPLTPDEEAGYDTTSPVILTTDPVHLDVDVSINLPIIITFDESVDPTFWKFTCSPDPGGWAEVWNATKEQVTLTHASFALNQGYTITVIWANDTVGNALAAGPVPNPWTFTTELVDNQPPFVESVIPTGSNVPVSSNIVITFNESMNTTSVESSIQIDPAVAYTVSWSVGNRTITIAPSIDFQYNKTYSITVNDTAKDMNDNPMTSHYTWSFTTSDPPLVDIIPPVSSITGLDAYQNSLAFDIDWTSYDPSGIKMVELYYTTDNGTSWTKYGTNFTASQISFTASGEGVYGFYIVATDDSTNQNRETEPASGDSPMASTHVDITAPIVGVGPDAGSNSVITIDATASDSGSGISSYLWTMVSGPGIITFTTANSEDTNIIADTDGTYVVRLTVIDNAGNAAYDEFQLVWDATRPTATISPDGSSTSVDSNITITFSEPVNKTMAESAFSISPVVTGTFIWNAAGTVMTYVPVSNLNYGTDYEVTIDSALIADNLGNQMLNDLTGTFTTASAPAGTGSITGQILDENGNGVPGATVSLDGTSYTTTTDSDGNFNLTDIPAGDYTQVIEMDGYDSQEMPVTVVSGEETSIPPVNLTPAIDPTPDWMWIIILLIAIVVVVAAVGGTIVKRSKSRQRKAMEEKEELEEDIEHSSIEAAEVMSVASAPAAQVLASTPEPTPPPPEPESEGIETELCPSCGFEIEKGTACPFCSSEPGVEEIHAEPVEEPVVQEPVREKPPAPTPEPEPEASQPAMLDNQEKIAQIEKAYKEGKITKEQYLNNLERFKK